MRYSPPIEALLKKMDVSERQSTVRYFLSAQNHIVDVNSLIKRHIKFSFLKKICFSCQKEVFGNLIQGFCYNCYQTSPMAGRNILHPEESKAHLGIEVRNLKWEKKLELQPHIVYLAASHDIKVGVTRLSQAFTRWVDQGAWQAIVVAKVPNRYLAGLAEVALKAHFRDKTFWQEMLKGVKTSRDLKREKENAIAFLPKEVKDYFCSSDQVYTFAYPLEKHPEMPRSIQLEKLEFFEGRLFGIKGQYLIFDDDSVLNIRRHSGQYVSIEVEI